MWFGSVLEVLGTHQGPDAEGAVSAPTEDSGFRDGERSEDSEAWWEAW